MQIESPYLAVIHVSSNVLQTPSHERNSAVWGSTDGMRQCYDLENAHGSMRGAVLGELADH